MAVLPAHDPAQRSSRARRELGLRVQDRASSSSTSCVQPQRRTGRSRSPIAHDTLEKPCYDMAGLTRQYDFLTTVSRYCNELGWGNYANDHEDANGQFEQNFTYDDALVSCDRAIFFRYMVHTLAEQHGMIATFMPKPFTQPDRQRLPLPHVALARRREPLPRRSRPARPRPVGARLQLHRRPEDARARLQRAHRADGQLVQAAEARLDDERRDLVAGLDLVRLQQPHADAADPGARAGSRTARSTAPATRTSRRRRCSPPGSTGSRTGSTPGEPNSENLYTRRYDELTERGLRDAARQPARGDRRARAGRRPPRGARPRPRRGLRRLLRRA